MKSPIRKALEDLLYTDEMDRDRKKRCMEKAYHYLRGDFIEWSSSNEDEETEDLEENEEEESNDQEENEDVPVVHQNEKKWKKVIKRFLCCFCFSSN